MPATVPAASLIALQQCTGQCLLALDDDCDCRCRGRWHGALTEARIPIDSAWRAPVVSDRRPQATLPPTPPPPSADLRLLLDILDVWTSGDETPGRMHSFTIVRRLAERFPTRYDEDFGCEGLAHGLTRFGITTRQLNMRVHPGGPRINRRGITFDELAAAIEENILSKMGLAWPALFDPDWHDDIKAFATRPA
ncbi:hypothetical protein ACL02T_32995 [Pseudonocardia sp. RS010]|uniref:hypothetical protein n=1 Tax=Pseudonocardia sp. RS010 TaxID=3385979 RepID=UPI0039A1DFCF